MLEHPDITRTLRTGYPEGLRINQTEHYGIDYFGDEILIGDDVVIDEAEIILKDNLERYLSEEYGFQFKTVD